jgi:hypothetical protein
MDWHHVILQSGAWGFNYENHQGPERFWRIGNNAFAAGRNGKKKANLCQK